MPIFNSDLETYIRETFAAEDSILIKIREQIKARRLPAITVKPEEGKFLQVLVAVSGARKALEIGTHGGYSGTWIARGLPPDGRLISLEVDADRAAVAEDHFHLAGLEARVEVRVGDAHMLLPDLADESPFDFIFIDADKLGYPAYLKQAPDLLRSGGVLAAHNVFRHGAVVDPPLDDSRTQAILKFNDMLAADQRWLTTVYPAGDGLAVAVLRDGGG
jgi:caffeoyl-CoA O-methyltransferase